MSEILYGLTNRKPFMLHLVVCYKVHIEDMCKNGKFYELYIFIKVLCYHLTLSVLIVMMRYFDIVLVRTSLKFRNIARNFLFRRWLFNVRTES
jgi:hypothetical protein